MHVLLVFAFIAGLVTILAPCIWPLLPIVLSTSINGGRAKSLGITLGILLSFALYNLSISYLVRIFGFNPEILRYLAIAILIALGLMMIVPYLSRVFDGLVSRLAGKVGGSVSPGRQGFGSGFITGLSLGIIWTPCAGPILTAIATLSATAQVTLDVILVTVAYLIGVGIPLFAFSYGGQHLVARTRFLSVYTGRIQQVFGVILLLTALAIATNYDKLIQARILDTLPSYTSFLTSFEQNQKVKEELDKLKNPKDSRSDGLLHFATGDDASTLLNVTNPQDAPEFVGITRWLNAERPLTMQRLRGNVVLVDFWTYTCINCIRTLPFVTSWYDKYKDKGLVVVGVHTPEFEFEKSTENVLDAIRRFNIRYPVAQDNDFATWNAYNNQYWPAEYLIDAKGRVRRVHFGEGEYDEMEKAIQLLLKEAGSKVDMPMTDFPDQTPKIRVSPETYLGSNRMEYYYPSNALTNGVKTLVLSEDPPENTFSLGGSWTITDEYAQAAKDATISYTFFADKVFLVMRPERENLVIKVKVTIDGQPVKSANVGADVDLLHSIITIDSDRLYSIADFQGVVGKHTIRLEFQTPGAQLFAFTFG